MTHDWSHLDKVASREIMLNRLPMLLGSEPGCNVRDWSREADDNPHVMQALNQGVAVRYAILSALTPSDLAALLAEKCPGWIAVPREPDENMLMHFWEDECGDWAEHLRIQAEADWRRTIYQAPKLGEDN